MSGNAGEGPKGGVNISGRVGSVGGDIVGRGQGSVIDPVTALAWSQVAQRPRYTGSPRNVC